MGTAPSPDVMELAWWALRPGCLQAGRLVNTNLNDFNNRKYEWVSDWYRQAMNNFWIPEEINLGVDIKDYRKLPAAERRAYDKILSFLIFLDSLQSANLPAVASTSRPTR